MNPEIPRSADDGDLVTGCQAQADRTHASGDAVTRVERGGRIVAEGDEAKLKDLEEKLRIGPSRSHVERVVSVYSESNGVYDNFDIR